MMGEMGMGGGPRPSAAYSALGGGAPAAPGPVGTAGPGGDPLTDALLRLNSQIQAAIEGQVQITPEAENQLKVTIVLIQQLAQQEQQKNAPAPGGPMSQTGPAIPPVSGSPGAAPLQT